ncbi:MAG: hypothetical protein CMM76_02700 [Rhodospirillaceae bacterium]|nr:hypothetical protein [Rhodospirillaceae bacterium]
MSITWNKISKERKERMELAFEQLHLVDLMVDQQLNAIDAADERPVGFQDLYSAAVQPEVAINGRIADALENNPKLRRDFETLLQQTGIAWFPVAAAAETATLDERDEASFLIRIRPSKANEDQVYVLVRLKEPSAVQPHAIIALPPEGVPIKKTLPVAVDSMFQLLMQRDEPLVRAIQDRRSKLSLQ